MPLQCLILSCILLILTSSSPSVYSQQPYEGIYTTDCASNYTISNSSTLLGYFCNGKFNSCTSYLIFRPTSQYNTTAAISSLLNAEASLLSQSNISSDSMLVIPVPCSCSGAYYQFNANYSVRTGDTLFTIANDTFQGLSTCQAIRNQNLLEVTSSLEVGQNLTIPLRCACPTTQQYDSGIRFLLTHLLNFGDSFDSIAQTFNTDATSITHANELSVNDLIFAFTRLLVPLKLFTVSVNTFVPPTPPPPPPPPPVLTLPNATGFNHTAADGPNGAENLFHSTDGAKSHIRTGVVIGIVLFIGLLALGICFLFYAKRYKKIWFRTEERKREELVEATLENFGYLAPKRYTFSEIRKITKSLNVKIGQGGYATVFKGELKDGSLVAVKVFKDRESSGVEFSSEVVSIARTSHVNIVRLIGFSIKGSKRALIYEFMPNGSLDKYLREIKNSTLSHVECTRLFEIAVGIARGLEYLHRGCTTRIVHFDIKPHNILLDQDYCPKISDFGLAKFCQPKESIISMSGLRGTIGYIAPEVFSRNFGAVSSKSDVYSYGMMILEMFGGKQGKTDLTDSTSDIYFPECIYKCVELNNICSFYGIPDASEEIVRKIMIVGLWCIQVMPQARPTMSAVLDMLDKSIDELSLPPPLNVSLQPAIPVQGAADLSESISYMASSR